MMEWTNEQAAAIAHDGSNLLVAAAAGSGKTAVLVERLMRLLCDADPVCDADRLLVVTFTNAAAAEMRRKIEKALRNRLALDPENQVLRRQQILLQKAQISTVHSFCQSLLRQYFYACDVDPGFSIIDATEGELLRKSVLADLLEERMHRSSTGFRKLSATLCRRGDRVLHETVLKLHGYYSSLPFFRTRLEAFCEELTAQTAFSETRWGRFLLQNALEELTEAETLLDEALTQAAQNPGLLAYLPILSADRDRVSTCLDACKDGWDALYESLGEGTFEHLPPCRDPAREEVQALRAVAKKIVAELTHKTNAPAAEKQKELQTIAPVVSELCNLICELDTRFSAAKAERGVLDFADLEQKTLSLLYETETQETPQATEIRGLFDAVLVDEYQDTNDTQEMIFKAVSNGRNLFTVGDVKQSIYTFRGAVPQLFLDRARGYETGAQRGRKIVLNRNFRSRNAVIDGINQLFERLLTASTGELCYNEEEALVFGQTAYLKEEDTDCTLVLVETGKQKSAEAKEAEARFVAQTISDWISAGETVSENGVKRPMRYSDIALLLRADRLEGQVFLKALKEREIPVLSDRGPSFFEQPEVQTALSLLQIIDNPIQDIPLLSVLRSPLCGFSEDRLLKLRGDCPEGDFYTVLCHAQSEGDKTVGAFLKRLRGWRERVGQEPLDRFLQELFYETDFDLFYGVQTGGKARMQRLQQLVELAAAFESNNYRGLSAFVRKLNTMAEKGEDPAMALSPETDNAVKLLSIHKSKGLEFPVVFVCETQKKLTHRENTPLFYHKDLGIGVDALDTRLQIRYPTAVSEAICRSKAQEELAEELRVLYVALTRAKERLILTATVADAQEKLQALSPRAITRGSLLRSSSYFEWVLAALAHAGNGFGHWRVQTVLPPAPGLAEVKAEVVEDRTFPHPQEKTIQTLLYQYPYSSQTVLPVKMTVTQLKRAATEEDGVLLHPKKASSWERPRFLRTSALTGAEEGDLTHRCFEHLSLSTRDIAEQLTQLREQGWITTEEEAQINPKLITDFLESPLFARMQASSALYREQSFETEMETPQGPLLVQGIIDCYFEEGDGLVLVDYKTDRVEKASELAERYRVQLEYYAHALARLTGKPVKEKLIWAARFGETVKL